MQIVSQIASDPFRVILIRRDASELLLTTRQTRFALPVLNIPRCSRIAEECTAALENRFGMRAYCLFTPEPLTLADRENPIRYALMEACRPNASHPKDTYWAPASSLSPVSFEDSADFAVFTQCLADLANGTGNSGSFAKPGWLRDVSGWVASQAASLGLRLTGEFRQFNASPTFSLIRFATGGPALWFKAVGEPNLHEFPLSLMLAIHFPEFVPRVVSYRERWNAWLTLEAGGAHLDENSGVTDWARAAETLASLQITSFGRALHLLAAGCKDVRIPSLLGLVDPFFAAMAERMEEQTKPSPQPLLRQEVLWLAAEIKVRLEQLAVCDIPNTLGHLDFNPGNILVSGERCVILDWAEACVGHPFFTLQYLLEHARRLHGDDPAWEEPLIKSYAKKWELYSSPEEIAAALQLVPLIAAFAYAAAGMAWRDSQVGRRPEAGGYLRSLTRRMKREADALREGSLVCLR